MHETFYFGTLHSVEFRQV